MEGSKFMSEGSKFMSDFSEKRRGWGGGGEGKYLWVQEPTPSAPHIGLPL